jgi:hypothetical protein
MTTPIRHERGPQRRLTFFSISLPNTLSLLGLSGPIGPNKSFGSQARTRTSQRSGLNETKRQKRKGACELLNRLDHVSRKLDRSLPAK